MTTPGYPANCWLTRKTQVRPSAIEGHGLFVNTPITTGQVMMRLGGQLIDHATWASLCPPYSSLTIGNGLHLPIDPAHPVCYGSHSCDPKLWHADATTVVARRHVKSGEELTIDYAIHTGIETWTMNCQCGSVICRGAGTDRPRVAAAAPPTRLGLEPTVARPHQHGERGPENRQTHRRIQTVVIFDPVRGVRPDRRGLPPLSRCPHRRPARGEWQRLPGPPGNSLSGLVVESPAPFAEAYRNANKS